jgi:hypothetical protein
MLPALGRTGSASFGERNGGKSSFAMGDRSPHPLTGDRRGVCDLTECGYQSRSKRWFMLRCPLQDMLWVPAYAPRSWKQRAWRLAVPVHPSAAFYNREERGFTVGGKPLTPFLNEGPAFSDALRQFAICLFELG